MKSVKCSLIYTLNFGVWINKQQLFTVVHLFYLSMCYLVCTSPENIFFKMNIMGLSSCISVFNLNA